MYLVLITVYDRLKNRINMAVRAKSKECIYIIPAIIPGYPLINLEKTMLYLLYKLKKEGFIALPLSTNQLYVTWDIKDVMKLDKLKKQQVINKESERIKINDTDDFIQTLINSKKNDRHN